MSTFSILLLFLVAAFPFGLRAQSNVRSCGAFYRSAESAVHPKEGDADLVDQFGNTYQWEDLRVGEAQGTAGAKVTACQSGAFDLNFTGFTANEEMTICSVFSYLSNHVAVGTQGSTPLIQVVKEGFVDANGAPDYTTLGVGIVFWRLECGLINPLIFDVMNSQLGQSLPQGFASAVLRINSNVLWHTVADDPMPPAPTPPQPTPSLYDLYSVSLHEAMHILGVASRLGDNNLTSSPTIFSRWDRFLWSDILHDYVLKPTTHPQAGCCDQMTFNPAFTAQSGNFPSDLLNHCASKIFFHDANTNLAQVNGNYLTGWNSGTINNTFSHLDACGSSGVNYVMTSSIAALEVKRTLDPAEVSILSAFGYAVPGATSQPCNVLALDDVIYVTQGDPSFAINLQIPGNQLVANDLAPYGWAITVDPNCGNAIASGLVALSPNQVWIKPWLVTLTPGQYTLCYTLTGCNGQCDDGILVIEVAPNLPPMPTCPPATTCNGRVWCHGDFQGMVPAAHSAQVQIGTQDCFGGSPDAILDPSNGNIAVKLGSEGIVIPLNPGISPGCTLEVNFDGSGGNGLEVALLVDEHAPCDDITPGTCPGAPNGAYECLANIPLTYDGFPSFFSTNCSNPAVLAWLPNCNYNGSLEVSTGPITFAHYSNTFPNNTQETWNYLYVSGRHSGPWKVIDNLEAIIHCDNEIELTSSETLPDHVCPGEISSIDVQVCMTGSNLNPSDVVVTVELPALPGLNIVPGSDFDGGDAVLTGMTPGSCKTLTVEVQVGYNFPAGTTLHVDLGMEGVNVCVSDESLTGYDIIVDDCQAEPCPAEWSIQCFDKDGYFCVVDGSGGSPYMQWVNPPFPNSPNGHCQPLAGLTPGQPLSFVIYVYDQGIFLCTATVNTTLPCGLDGGHDFGGGGRGKTDAAGDAFVLEVYPNPIAIGSAQDQVSIRFVSEWEGEGRIRLFDVQGRQVIDQPITVAKGSNQRTFALGDLPAGVYALSLIGGGTAATRLIRIE
jgi:hypothetical protein